MMKLLAIPMVALLLSGCLATTRQLPQVETRILEKIEYVVRVPPVELTELPAMPMKIDVDEATQSIIAQWVISNEEYILKLREQLILIGKFLRDEQIKLDKEAQEKNSKAGGVLNGPEPLNGLK
jgi:PBP1b-binding outer membrane lipoprotein LpoB